MQSQVQPSQGEQPFAFQFTKPFSTFEEGKPTPTPYVIDGMFTEGGFSILAGKPKQGKSSLSRFAAVCVVKGQLFLGRKVKKSEVLLLSLEDPLAHVDLCLHVLGYDPAQDCEMRIVDRSAFTVDDNLAALEQAIKSRPKVKFVIIDTLTKFLRVDDTNEFMAVQRSVERLRNLARDHHIHILALAHRKKVSTDDPFDSILGTVAFRAETDTNIVIYHPDNGERVIATESRMGKFISPRVLVFLVVVVF